MSEVLVAFIFDPASSDGIEGKFVFHTDRESLLDTVAQEVDALNRDLDEPLEFEWTEDAYYPKDGSGNYGEFAWAKLQTAYAGSVLGFSEFG